ncbi:MAG: carboxypeptidase-like regulatory domain-containing protein, partial [Candidatus Korobacteraceae bacterium]
MSTKLALRLIALLVAIGLAFTCSFANAQSSVSGSISGTVMDSSGALIAGATVTVTNTDRGEDIRVLTTNKSGFYAADSLPLGTYKVTFGDHGFKTEVVNGLMLNAADALTINQTLTPGGANEIVQVTAGEAQLNLEDATSQGLINSTQLNEMPLVTRNYETLMNLEPGVVYGGATDDLTRGPAGIGGAS